MNAVGSKHRHHEEVGNQHGDVETIELVDVAEGIEQEVRADVVTQAVRVGEHKQQGKCNLGQGGTPGGGSRYLHSKALEALRTRFSRACCVPRAHPWRTMA